MSANESTITLPSLTDLEKRVLRDLLPSFSANGEDFSYTGDITVPMSQARGCLSSLSQKCILVVWPEETNADGITYTLVQWASSEADPEGRAMSRAVRAVL